MIWIFLAVLAYVAFHLEYYYKFFSKVLKVVDSGVLYPIFAIIWLGVIVYQFVTGNWLASILLAGLAAFFILGHLQRKEGN